MVKRTEFCCDHNSARSRRLVMIRNVPKSKSQMKSKIYRCSYCNTDFAKQQLRDKHIRDIHKKYRCSKCKTSFLSEIALEAHVKKKH